ncbi:hypothetical protein [Nocardioides insulae]|uniref:hypothetical protein n=1 Tax=Nocardioides insulae TaxID=394734 RepID=UPI0004169DC1|nr:hypothetical protein [Nocardioides insulae]
MSNEPVMLPIAPGQRPFLRGWGLAGLLVMPVTPWGAMSVIAVLGLDPDSVGGNLVAAVCCALTAVAAFFGLRELQRRDGERRVERYARDRLPSLQRIAADHAYSRGGFADLEEAWRSVEAGAMEFWAKELAIVREVYRNYNRLCWLPVQYVSAYPALIAMFALGNSLAMVTGLSG